MERAVAGEDVLVTHRGKPRVRPHRRRMPGAKCVAVRASSGMTDTSPTTSMHALDAYVEALMRCTGTLMLIVDHMAAWDATLPPDTPPDASAPDTLRRLVKDVIAPALGNRAPGGLSEAAALLDRTADVLGSDIFLVDPGDPDPAAA